MIYADLMREFGDPNDRPVDNRVTVRLPAAERRKIARSQDAILRRLERHEEPSDE